MSSPEEPPPTGEEKPPLEVIVIGTKKSGSSGRVGDPPEATGWKIVSLVAATNLFAAGFGLTWLGLWVIKRTPEDILGGTLAGSLAGSIGGTFFHSGFNAIATFNDPPRRDYRTVLSVSRPPLPVPADAASASLLLLSLGDLATHATMLCAALLQTVEKRQGALIAGDGWWTEWHGAVADSLTADLLLLLAFLKRHPLCVGRDLDTVPEDVSGLAELDESDLPWRLLYAFLVDTAPRLAQARSGLQP